MGPLFDRRQNEGLFEITFPTNCCSPRYFHIISLKHCAGIILRCHPWETSWVILKLSLISSFTAQLFTCCRNNNTANILYIILSMTNHFLLCDVSMVSENFVLLKLCPCLCFPFLGYAVLFIVVFVYYVSIILSKFQPAMVLLSGLIFTCPVPSPAVTLRV